MYAHKIHILHLPW